MKFHNHVHFMLLFSFGVNVELASCCSSSYKNWSIGRLICFQMVPVCSASQHACRLFWGELVSVLAGNDIFVQMLLQIGCSFVTESHILFVTYFPSTKTYYILYFSSKSQYIWRNSSLNKHSYSVSNKLWMNMNVTTLSRTIN